MKPLQYLLCILLQREPWKGVVYIYEGLKKNNQFYPNTRYDAVAKC